MLLTREAILAADDIKTQEVPVPEWGGSVLVRTLTGTERDSFELEQLKDRRDFRARLSARAMCDEAGNRLFSDADVAALAKKSAAALDRVFDVATTLAKFSEKDVDDLGGKSAPSPGSSSPSV